MQHVRVGDLPWMNIDALHRMILDDLLVQFGMTQLGEEEKDHLNRVWHRLDIWPDAREGIERLRRRFLVEPISAGIASFLPNWRIIISPIRRSIYVLPICSG